MIKVPVQFIRSSFLALFTGLLLCACATQHQYTEQVHYYQVKTEKLYEDVLAELKLAISEHNFRITAHSQVGKIIRQRGAINFPDYDTIQFCNLSRARKLLLLAADAVRHMPCNIVLYSDAGRVIVNARLLPVDTGNKALNQFSSQINQSLREIVDFAIEE